MHGPIDTFGAKVLIVDDQQTNLQLLECVLRRAGYTAVASTADPRTVCDLHRRNRYDLMILDLQMPHMNGFEVMEALAGVAGARAAILVLSADPSQMVRALEAGATGFLSKPFVLDELVRRVGLTLEKALASAPAEEDELLQFVDRDLAPPVGIREDDDGVISRVGVHPENRADSEVAAGMADDALPGHVLEL